jgi:tartrate-resistant acid phosphatase type 5
MRILVVDTVLLCGNSGYDWHLEQPKMFTKSEKQFASDYLAAIERNLKEMSESQAAYLLVAGHFPIWSVAEHGPTQCLIDKLRPLLHQYGVSAYLCGHDHNMQHIVDEYMDQRVDHVLSGASNFNDNSTVHMNAVPENSARFHWPSQDSLASGAVALFNADENRMNITFIETNGKEIYNTVIYPRKRF